MILFSLVLFAFMTDGALLLLQKRFSHMYKAIALINGFIFSKPVILSHVCVSSLRVLGPDLG
jgi:hypothetical protein